MTHSCPRCELRFSTQVELSDHLELDHAVHTEVVEGNDDRGRDSA